LNLGLIKTVVVVLYHEGQRDIMLQMGRYRIDCCLNETITQQFITV